MDKPKLTKKQAKKYFAMLSRAEDLHSANVMSIEKIMAKETGIEDIEFFMCDNWYCGIGNASRTMKLIHREDV